MEEVAVNNFSWMLWAGVALTLVGFAGVVYSIFRVARAKRSNLSQDALRDVIKSSIPVNIGAFFISALGLMLVVFSIILI